MLTLPFRRRPPGRPAAAPGPPALAASPADPGAAWLVVAAVVGMGVLLFTFVAKYTTRFPVFDEYCHLEILLGDPSYWARGLFWQHNEHRIPLPRLVYWLLVSGSGFNFKVPCYFNAACLTVATLALLTAVRQARGHHVYADAAVPLLILSPGQWENLLWGFQVQFVLSTCLILGFVALVLSPRFAESTWRVGAAGAVGMLLPLCGANGVAFNPALVAFLGWVGARGVLSREPGNRRPAAVALAGAALAAALVPLYFLGLAKADHHPAAGPLAAAKGTLQVLALTFGPVGHLAESPGADPWPVVGVLVAGSLALTALLFLWSFRDPGQRVRAAGLAAAAAGVVALAAGIGYGRAGVGPILPVNRYVTLMLPLAVVLYLCWSLLPGHGLSRAAGTALLLAAAACVWPNTAEGRRAGLLRAATLTRCEMDVRAGVPLTEFVDRHPVLYPGSREQRLKHVRDLKAKGVRPFAQIPADPR